MIKNIFKKIKSIARVCIKQILELTFILGMYAIGKLLVHVFPHSVYFIAFTIGGLCYAFMDIVMWPVSTFLFRKKVL